MSLGLEPSFSLISFCSTLINPLGGLAYNGFLSSACKYAAVQSNTLNPNLCFAVNTSWSLIVVQLGTGTYASVLSKWTPDVMCWPPKQTRHFRLSMHSSSGVLSFVRFVKKLTTICHTRSVDGKSSHATTSNTLKLRRFPISFRITSFHEFPASGVSHFFYLMQSSTVMGSALYTLSLWVFFLELIIAALQSIPWMGLLISTTSGIVSGKWQA